MTNVYCLDQTLDKPQMANMVILYDKITDVIVCTHDQIGEVSTNPDDGKTIRVVVPQTQIDELKKHSGILDSITNKDPNNIGVIYIAEDLRRSHIADYCVVDGVLVKKYSLELTCDAVDSDGDGLPDIDGDGQDTAEFILRVLNEQGQVMDWNGVAEARTERGKLLGTVSGRFNIVNGVGSFTLRSAPETVRELVIRVWLVGVGRAASQRAKQPTPVKMNFR